MSATGATPRKPGPRPCFQLTIGAAFEAEIGAEIGAEPKPRPERRRGRGREPDGFGARPVAAALVLIMLAGCLPPTSGPERAKYERHKANREAYMYQGGP